MQHKRREVKLKDKTVCYVGSINGKHKHNMVAFIPRNFDCKTSQVMLTLYNFRVRPHLQYAVQFVSHKKGIKLLESVIGERQKYCRRCEDSRMKNGESDSTFSH